MKIKVTSDGTACGTKIVNAENNEPIENVSNIVLHCSPNGLWTAIVKMQVVECDVIADMISTKEKVS